MLTLTEGIVIVIISSILGPLLVNHFKDKKTAEHNAELLTKMDGMTDQISNLAGIMAVSLDSINFIGNLAHETAICVENDGKHNGRHKKALKDFEDFELAKKKVLNKKLAQKEG
jgi:hypothetical protein